MKALLNHRLLGGVIPAAIVLFSATTCTALATAQRIIIDHGDNALTREDAREKQEQWNATRNLRKKINERVEYNFDKNNIQSNLQEKCLMSEDIHAYWENNTSRCLDRRTGRAIVIP